MKKIKYFLGAFICDLLAIYYTLKHGVFITGHNYIEQENDEIICTRCGKDIQDFN